MVRIYSICPAMESFLYTIFTPIAPRKLCSSPGQLKRILESLKREEGMEFLFKGIDRTCTLVSGGIVAQWLPRWPAIYWLAISLWVRRFESCRCRFLAGIRGRQIKAASFGLFPNDFSNSPQLFRILFGLISFCETSVWSQISSSAVFAPV